MNKYSLWFGYVRGNPDTHTAMLADSEFTAWNERIERQETIAFHNIRGDMVVINTRFLVGYQVRVEG